MSEASQSDRRHGYGGRAGVPQGSSVLFWHAFPNIIRVPNMEALQSPMGTLDPLGFGALGNYSCVLPLTSQEGPDAFQTLQSSIVLASVN